MRSPCWWIRPGPKRSEYFDYSPVLPPLIGYTFVNLIGVVLVGRAITAFASME